MLPGTLDSGYYWENVLQMPDGGVVLVSEDSATSVVKLVRLTPAGMPIQ